MSTRTIMTTSGSETALDDEAVTAFAAQLRGSLLHPGDAGYDESRSMWNGMFDRRPAVVARCAGPGDVMAAVHFARAHELLVSIKGGGHNSAGLAVCDRGLLIDLSPMRGVRPNLQTRTMHVQAGAIWSDVDREAQPFTAMVPGGVVSDTGVAGLTLSGGYGWTRRKHGMTIDNLVSVDMVLADGRYVHASASHNPELFWGVCGGGGNFGIITSFEFQMHDLGPEVAFLGVMYPAEEATKVLRGWREFVATAPDEVTTDGLRWSLQPGFPEPLVGKEVVGVVGMYAGPADAGERALAPLRQLATPLIDTSSILPYVAAQSAFDPLFPRGKQRYWKSLYLRDLEDPTLAAIVDHAAARPSPQTLISIRHLGGAMARVPAHATAFGDRSSPFLISLDSTWDDPAESAANMEWARSTWADLHRFSSGVMYMNFCGLLEEGQQLMSASYGDNYERLVALKNTYDPTNFFRNNQNIKPTTDA